MSRLSRTYRSFADIRRAGNSARILNLLDPTQKIEADEENDGDPGDGYFFSNYTLNRSFILKHRLRPQEREILGGLVTVGTKIFIPFDVNDLRQGGKYVFINERDSGQIFHANFGVTGQSHAKHSEEDALDIQLLNIIDALPSLDPFILRERLRMHGYEPHAYYFELSEREFTILRDKIEADFAPLIAQAFAGMKLGGQLSAFVRKLWDAEDAKEMVPLLKTMQVSEEDFPETIFAWKGFVYYKSLMGSFGKDFMKLTEAIEKANITGLSECPIASVVTRLQDATLTGLRRELRTVTRHLKNYEEAYFDGLIREGDPKRFSDFLGNSPRLFQSLGASLGAMRHAVSFWQFRFGGFGRVDCDVYEFLEIMRDFAHGLSDASEEDLANLLQEAAMAQSA